MKVEKYKSGDWNHTHAHSGLGGAKSYRIKGEKDNRNRPLKIEMAHHRLFQTAKIQKFKTKESKQTNEQAN